ncbi:MvaI/BcnI family restriction endonuclease [Maricaulis sp.]|uniref:MvaI/BcnI family restriction endonuclease n=1 Tax=Maricaulis sp. TaxID=1486257 RepID=UPI002B26CCA1|nr:MvaI/BcnI family restriction endonuclease [Maricaulis sp.]
MGIATLGEFKDLFRRAGVRTVYVKHLATKQDNEKNQVVLASEMNGLVNLFPARMALRAASQSRMKRNSSAGRPIAEASLYFFWMDRTGARFHAPRTRLIEYFQYPEVRLSGFLDRCQWAPDAIRRDRQATFGQRILAMGANSAGEVVGLLLTETEDALVADFPDLSPSGVSGVLGVLSTTIGATTAPRELLISDLRGIVASGWHPSVRNKGGKIVPFSGNQGAGYTLEAALGVETNALKAPDIHGYEVKSYRGSKISLMTPTADCGAEGEMGFRDFMNEFAKPSTKGDGSARFVGLFRAGRLNKTHGLVLGVAGYDPETDQFSAAPEDVRVELKHHETGRLVSGWSLEKLANSWNSKHAAAVYVRAEARAASKGDEYRFLQPWLMCEGTDIWRLLRAIAVGRVYYDPAHTIYPDGSAKVRPQWRVGTSKFEESLRELYARVKAVS